MIACFRVDSSIEIGTGHVTRCLTLAEALRKRGVHCFFICRVHHGNLLVQIRDRGFEVHSLPIEIEFNKSHRGQDKSLPVHAAWLGSDWVTDAAQTKFVIAERAVDWLIVDHYALDERWELALLDAVKKILVIDDIADRRHDCDVLLDQNLYADMEARYVGKVPARCQLLLGPRYALLREEFARLHSKANSRNGEVRRILVFFGGIDANNYTGYAMDALSAINVNNFHVDVVIGSQHPLVDQTKKICVQHGFVCHVQTDHMAELMMAADIAIGAAGSASWERCCLGLPALLVALADNQVDIAKGLEYHGAAVYIGTSETASLQCLQRAIVSFCSAQNLLKELSEKSYLLVDGFGIERICQEMGC